MKIQTVDAVDPNRIAGLRICKICASARYRAVATVETDRD